MQSYKIQEIREAWVQCELYRKLVELGYYVQPEYVVQLKKRRLRADLAVFKGDKFIAFIEVKNHNNKVRGIKKEGAQYKKYLETGARFVYCLHKDDIDSTIAVINAWSDNL